MFIAREAAKEQRSSGARCLLMRLHLRVAPNGAKLVLMGLLYKHVAPREQRQVSQVCDYLKFAETSLCGHPIHPFVSQRKRPRRTQYESGPRTQRPISLTDSKSAILFCRSCGRICLGFSVAHTPMRRNFLNRNSDKAWCRRVFGEA